MKTEWRQPTRMATILVITFGMFIGCASVFQRIDDQVHRKQYKSDYEAYENALSVYDEGDFTEALARFKVLLSTSDSDKISSRAWLGEICCQLMLANTQAEYTAAIGKWHDFIESVTGNNAVLDIALFEPLVVRMIPKTSTRVIKYHSTEAQMSDIPAAPAEQISDKTAAPGTQISDKTAAPGTQISDIPAAPADRQLQVELADLKRKIKQVIHLQSQLDKVTAENHSLKEKIKALEAIDQNIQKKKTEIATPSE